MNLKAYSLPVLLAFVLLLNISFAQSLKPRLSEIYSLMDETPVSIDSSSFLAITDSLKELRNDDSAQVLYTVGKANWYYYNNKYENGLH